MKILVSGGNASGKSEYAENIAISLREKEQNLIYIATMKPYGDEAMERIERHHKLRETKGFETIECYNELSELVVPNDSVILLECLSNLMANELFPDKDNNGMDENGYYAVLGGVEHLEKEAEHLVVVTNNIFSDGIKYDSYSVKYQKYLAQTNRILAARFDELIEVVCGRPLYHKREAEILNAGV